MKPVRKRIPTQIVPCVPADGNERDDLGGDSLSDRLHAELHDGAELGGLQLRDAGGGVWISFTQFACGGFFFLSRGAAGGLVWWLLSLVGSFGGASHTTRR